MLCEGQVVVAIHDVHSEAEGYLQVWQGGELEVLYVGSGVREEEGWIYGQKIYGKEEGWVRGADVAARWTVVATSSYSGSAEGYISCQEGELLRVLYKGNTHEEKGWLWVASVLSENGKKEGWLPEKHVKPVEEQREVLAVATLSRSGSAPQKTGGTKYTEKADAVEVGSRAANVGGCIPSSRVNSFEIQAQLMSESRVAMQTNALQQDAGPNANAEVTRQVHTVTFGLENMDSRLYDMCAGQGAHIQVEEKVLDAALKRRKIDADVILDARMFPDPDSQNLRRHSGRHHGIITRLCEHRNFDGWLWHAKQVILRACQRKCAQVGMDRKAWCVTVALYCRSGKHRSVAGARIIEHILASAGFESVPVTHLSQSRWGSSMCKGMCFECQNPPPELQDVLNRAYEKWQKFGA